MVSNQLKDPPKMKLESMFMKNKDTRGQIQTFFQALTHFDYLNYRITNAFTTLIHHDPDDNADDSESPGVFDLA